jgi:creatinine amidohydrolase/Fe(II)-dependent formamide hydrolase-like protein
MTTKALVLALVSLLFGCAVAWAQGPDTVLLEELTWTEVRDRVKAGHTTILIPLGGTEQNGPHMALGKHNVRVRALSERIGRGLGNALVAPVLAYVPEGGLTPPTGHMRFPGTITVPEDTFEKVIESAARGFRLHGFRDIVFLGDSGSTQAAQRAVAARLTSEWKDSPVRVHAGEEYYRAAEVDFPRMLRERGFREDEVGKHAGLADTSLTLAVDPRLVRTDRLKPEAGPDIFDGVDGNPRKSTVALGKLGADAIAARTVDAIRKAVARR